MIVAILTQLATMYFVTSWIEWWAHKNLMHKRTKGAKQLWYDHAILHHKKYFDTCKEIEETPESRVNVRIRWGIGAVLMLLVSPFLLFWFWSGWVGVAITLIWPLLFVATWNAIHDEMHFPKERWFHNTRLFKFLKEWHCDHHDSDGKTNYGILCLGADWIMKSYEKH